jgi:hypothetical protein
MATTDILNIWNNAIGNLGVKTSISGLTEQSAEAAACALNYPTMIKALLRKVDWNCVRRTVALSDVTATFAPPARWAYRFAYPANCLRVWRIEDPAGTPLWRWPMPVQGFEVLMDQDPASSNKPTRYICSNWTGISAVFTEYAFDATKGDYEALFDDMLIDAASWGLAAEIASPLTGNASIISAASNKAAQLVADAAAANANESATNNMDDYPAESLQVRGFNPNIWPGALPPWWPRS